jgi:hypothetical protein
LRDFFDGAKRVMLDLAKEPLWQRLKMRKPQVSMTDSTSKHTSFVHIMVERNGLKKLINLLVVARERSVIENYSFHAFKVGVSEG